MLNIIRVKYYSHISLALFLSMVFRQSRLLEQFSGWAPFILYKSLFCIASPMWLTRMSFGIGISSSDTSPPQGLMVILFREEARVFSLLDVKTEMAALANDDITLVCEIKDERTERYSRKISALVRVRVYLIHEKCSCSKQQLSKGTVCLLMKYIRRYTSVFFNDFKWS